MLKRKEINEGWKSVNVFCKNCSEQISAKVLDKNFGNNRSATLTHMDKTCQNCGTSYFLRSVVKEKNIN